MSPDFNTISVKTSIWQESFTRNISWVRIDHGRNLEKGDILTADVEEQEKMEASGISSKSQCKRRIDNSEGRRIDIPSRR